MRSGKMHSECGGPGVRKRSHGRRQRSQRYSAHLWCFQKAIRALDGQHRRQTGRQPDLREVRETAQWNHHTAVQSVEQIALHIQQVGRCVSVASRIGIDRQATRATRRRRRSWRFKRTTRPAPKHATRKYSRDHLCAVGCAENLVLFEVPKRSYRNEPSAALLTLKYRHGLPLIAFKIPLRQRVVGRTAQSHPSITIRVPHSCIPEH